ncbi:hypothetical protein MRX96_057605 [Rhipicephalus microplus]
MPFLPGHQYLGPGNPLRNGGVLTSLSRLPVDRPYLYIPHGTYLDLPSHARAVRCTVKVTPHGLRTPWKTGIFGCPTCQL